MTELFGKEQWVNLFRKAGLTDVMMADWHRLFEAEYPETHQSFLRWLKLSEAEIVEIRQRFS